MKRVLISAVAAVLLGGCATPYQPVYAGQNGGYFDARISDKKYTVSFAGNGFCSPQYSYDMAVLRAADLGSQMGYSWMAVLGAQPISDPMHPAFAIQVTYSTGRLSVRDGDVFNTSSESEKLRAQYRM